MTSWSMHMVLLCAAMIHRLKYLPEFVEINTVLIGLIIA